MTIASKVSIVIGLVEALTVAYTAGGNLLNVQKLLGKMQKKDRKDAVALVFRTSGNLF